MYRKINALYDKMREPWRFLTGIAITLSIMALLTAEVMYLQLSGVALLLIVLWPRIRYSSFR